MKTGATLRCGGRLKIPAASIGCLFPKSWGGSHFWMVFILTRMFLFLTKVGDSCLFCFIYFGQDVPDFHSPMKGQSYGWSSHSGWEELGVVSSRGANATVVNHLESGMIILRRRDSKQWVAKSLGILE